MKKYLDALRYHVVFSRAILLVALPFTRLGRFAEWLKPRVKKNGGTVSYYGVQLVFPVGVGINILSRIYWFGEKGFEQYFGRYIMASARKAHTFIDIGSNFGFYSVLLCKVNPSIYSYCFEPVHFLQMDNRRFHEVNKVLNYELIGDALGEENGSALIMIPSQRFLRSLITSSTLSQDFANEKGFHVDSVKIEVQQLDTFAKKPGISDRLKRGTIVMKIDVEGFEASVLRGGEWFFLEFRPIVFIEIYLKRDNLDNILSFVEQVKYRVYAFSNIGLVNMSREAMYNYHFDRNFVLIPVEGGVEGLLSLHEFEQL